MNGVIIPDAFHPHDFCIDACGPCVHALYCGKFEYIKNLLVQCCCDE